MVLDVDDLHVVQVERHDQAFDGTRVAVLRRCRAHEGQRSADQRRVLVLVLRAVVTGRPWVDHRQAEVGDTPFAHGLLPPRVLPHLLLHPRHVFDEIGRESAGNRCPRVDHPRVEVDDSLVDQLGGTVVHRHERLTRHLGVPRERQRGSLGRLGQLNHHEFQRRCGVVRFGDDGRGRLDLGTGQRIQWIAAGGIGGLGRHQGAVHGHRGRSSLVAVESSAVRSNTARWARASSCETLCAERRPKM